MDKNVREIKAGYKFRWLDIFHFAYIWTLSEKDVCVQLWDSKTASTPPEAMLISKASWTPAKLRTRWHQSPPSPQKMKLAKEFFHWQDQKQLGCPHMQSVLRPWDRQVKCTIAHVGSTRSSITLSMCKKVQVLCCNCGGRVQVQVVHWPWALGLLGRPVANWGQRWSAMASHNLHSLILTFTKGTS